MNRQYIGARYVPKFYRNSLGGTEWEFGVPYEAMVIVTSNDTSFTSRKPVPVGVGKPSENPEYWAVTGNYNAQVERYRQDIVGYKAEAEAKMDSNYKSLKKVTDDYKNSTEKNMELFEEDVANTLEEYREGFAVVQAEQTSNISALKSRMDTFTALPEGSTTGDAELMDGRVAFDGLVSKNIGDSIRDVTRFNFDLTKYYEQGAEMYTPTMNVLNSMYVDSDHYLVESESFDCIDMLRVMPGQCVNIEAYFVHSINMVSIWNADGTFVHNYHTPSNGGIQYVTYYNYGDSITYLRINLVKGYEYKVQLSGSNSAYHLVDGYVRKDGTIVPQSREATGNYAYTTPFYVKRGQTINVVSSGSPSTAILSSCNKNGGNIEPLIIGDDNSASRYKYVATTDGYYIATFHTGGLYNIKIEDVRPSTAECLANTKEKCVINFIFDDGCAEDEELVNIFLESGLKCGFALPTVLGIGVQKYIDLYKCGFDVLAHSTDGTPMNDDSATISQIREKMVASKKYLEPLGFSVRGWVTPSSSLNSRYQSQLNNIYDYAYTVYYDTSQGGRAHNTKEDDVREMHRVHIANNFADAKTIIDSAVNDNGFLTFYFHGRDLDDAYRTALRDTLNYINELEDNETAICLAPNSAFDYYFHK